MVKKPTKAETVRQNRLRWVGHVHSMEGNRILKKVLYMILFILIHVLCIFIIL